MMLVDQQIIELIKNGSIRNADESHVGSVCYDVSTKGFCNRNKKNISNISLNPSDSIFVESEEIVKVPNDLVCKVHLRNSRIRQGLSLDAPIYYPGHETRIYYRITNVSGDVIDLDTVKGIASITFERLEKKPNEIYNGTFQSEVSFSDMADYTGIYNSQIKEIEKKSDKLEKMETKIYGSVVTILTIFVAIFSLINVNVSIVAKDDFSLSSLIIFDLATVACVSVLFGLMNLLIKKDSKLGVIIPIAISVVFFSASIIFRLCLINIS